LRQGRRPCPASLAAWAERTLRVPCRLLPPPKRFLDDQGYYVSNTGYKGPFLPGADLQAKKPIELKGVNLFCVKKTLHDAVIKAYGAWPQKSGRRLSRATAGGDGGGGDAAAAAAATWARWLKAAAGGRAP
jgi:hypothetical protein